MTPAVHQLMEFHLLMEKPDVWLLFSCVNLFSLSVFLFFFVCFLLLLGAWRVGGWGYISLAGKENNTFQQPQEKILPADHSGLSTDLPLLFIY